MKTTKQMRVENIIEYARKVLQYPKGSKGYDPVDEENLRWNLEKYDEELLKETFNL